MKSQAAFAGVKQSVLSPESDLWRHTAVHPLADHEAPLAEHQAPRSDGRDFSRVPVHAFGPDGGHAEVLCPLTPRRCPFGGACHTCPTHVQATLTIGQPGDAFEQEADRVAHEVIQAPKASPVHPSTSSNVLTSDGPSIVQQVQHASGYPLGPATRAFFEPRFGYDFGQVRLHTDGQASESARVLTALAYTVGRDVVFAQGQYDPNTAAGKRLLAHELTHVVQQNQAGSSSLPVTQRPVGPTIQRYVSPLDILDYIGIAVDVAERIYLTHFYEGNDREFQLALNLVYTAIDVVMVGLPGVGGGGLVVRASHGALAIAWQALPASAKTRVIGDVARGMGWSAVRAGQFINHLMRRDGEGGRGQGEEVSSTRRGTSHPEQRAGWRGRAREWFRENGVRSTGRTDSNTGKLIWENRATGRNKQYYTIDEWHGQIEVFNYRRKHIGFIDIERQQTVFEQVPGREIRW
jgi:hypothetical protein